MSIGRFSHTPPITFQLHRHALRLLLIREFGSFAVFAEVSFFFMPVIRAQKLFFRGPPSGCGAFNPGFPGFARL
jgi:hypothetical protein